VIERPPFPLAPAQLAFRFAQSPGDRQDEAPGEVSARIGQHVGRVGRDDAAGAAGVEIEVVVANRDIGHHPELRPGGVQHLVIDAVGQKTDQPLLPGNAFEQFLARNGRSAVVKIDVGARLEPGKHRGRNPSGQQDVRPHIPSDGVVAPGGVIPAA
jgi:hypothetical protein